MNAFVLLILLVTPTGDFHTGVGFYATLKECNEKKANIVRDISKAPDVRYYSMECAPLKAASSI
jgi:hypothetical protein